MRDLDMLRISLSLSGENVDNRVRPHVAEIGLIRTEYIMRREGAYVTTKRGKLGLSRYVEQIEKWNNRSKVWIRTSDFEAREISTLDGCDMHIVDENPILGERGIRRAQLFPDTFRSELEAIVAISQKFANICLLFSYVPDIQALKFALSMAKNVGWCGPVGVMVETPSAVMQIEEFVRTGISRVTVGLNDLTTLLLGCARSSPHWKKNHTTVLDTLDSLRGKLNPLNIEYSVAGNFTLPEFNSIKEIGIPHIILHYSELERLYPDRFTDLSDRALVSDIKRRTSQLLKSSRHG